MWWSLKVHMVKVLHVMFLASSEPAKFESTRVSKAKNAQTQKEMVSLRLKTQNTKHTQGCAGITEVSQRCHRGVARCRGGVAEVSRRCHEVSQRCREVSRGCRGGVAEVSRGVTKVSRGVTEVSTGVPEVSLRRHLDTNSPDWSSGGWARAAHLGGPLRGL